MSKIPTGIVSFLFKPSIVDGLISNFLWWFILAILSAVYLNATNRLYPLLYKFLGQKIASALRYFVSFLIHPLLRVFILVFLLVHVNIQQNDLLLSLGIFLIALSFFWQPKRKFAFNPIPQFSDNFEDSRTLTKNWERKTGQPQIESDFGKPAPDLGLKSDPSQATNSFVLLKEYKEKEGIIECDFYLEPGSLFNMVFLCDSTNDNWFMARFESRERNSDGILIKDQGPGNNWREHVMSGTRTSPRMWHRARVEFNAEKILMFRDSILIAEAKSPTTFGDRIGLFNECSDVHVDNFSFIKKEI